MASDDEISGFFSKRVRLFSACFLLAACTSFAYWNVDKCGFLSLDDQEYVYENGNVVRGPSINGITWAFTTFQAANWHPLTWLSHMLDCRIFGLNPAGHHLVNLAFHILNTVLLFIVLKSMTGVFWRSALVAALFGLHPLHVESVAWISERKDVLCAFFMLLSLLSYGYYVSRRKHGHYFSALFLFALGLMAKPMIVTFPFALLLLDIWPLRRFKAISTFDKTDIQQKHDHKAWIFLEKIPFFFLALGSCIVTVIAQKNSGAIMGLVNLPVGARISNAMLAYGEYLKKTFWPTDLSFFYPLTTTMPGPGGKLAAAVFILLLVTIIAIIFLKKTPSLFVGWFWFLGTLAPVIGIIQVGNQAMADRYAYIPLIGLGISFAWLVADFAGKNRWNKAIALSGLAVVLVLLALQTRKQTGYWKSDETLADHAILVTRDNYLAYSMKGHCLLQRNDFKGAKQCHQKALALFPRLDVSRLNLAYINLVQGNNRDAIAVLKEVLARDSLHTLANHLCGLAYAGLDDYVRAEACFARALKKDPAYGPASQAMRLINERKKGMDPATNYFHALPGPAPAARR